MRAAVLLGLAALLAACVGREPAGAPADPPTARTPPVGLNVAEGLRYPPLRFDPPEPERFELSNGVTVFFLEDRTLPVFDLFVDLRGGYVHFDREYYAAASAVPSLMRNGGTAAFTPDSLDALIEFHALGISTSTDGGRVSLGVSGLSRQLDLVARLWSEMLLRPRFDEDAVERWRIRELEAVRRIGDFPGSLAVLEFNHLMFGDHPTGWVMTEADLAPPKLDPARLRRLHGRMTCPQDAVIGASGAVEREELRATLERVLADWEPCRETLTAPAPPTLRVDRRVYVVPKTLSQSTIVVGQPGGVRVREDDAYFSSRVANWIVGGSGFTSRLVNRLRTEEGLAYSAASIWGAARNHERIFGAITHTKAESTIPAARMLLDVIGDAVADPPGAGEVQLAREAIVNGFVFGFGSPSQVVARQVAYLADGFPEDWLTRYVDGIRQVDTASVARVLERHVNPRDFTILIVGDTSRFDASVLGPVTYLPPRR